MAVLGEEGPVCPACGRDASACTPRAHHLPPGTMLAERYLLGAVLGEGGFGITYLGLDTRLDVKVAIKEYYPRDKASRSAAGLPEVVSLVGLPPEGFARGLQRFLEEARAMARMEKQPAIVGVRDYFEANGTAYIVMEFVEGITLTELAARRGGRVPPEELFSLLEPVCLALEKLHSAGLVHRDISPDNIMLEDGHARLLDFGCARETAAGRQTLTISLKYGYAPIEQYRQKGQGPWTDVYALCATMYYCLTGQMPPQPLDRIPEDALLLPSKLGVPLTGRQEQAILKGLRIQPRRRFRSMRQLYEALYENASPLPERRGDWQPPEKIAVTGLEKPSLRGKGLTIAAGIVALALALTGGLWAFSERFAPGPAADAAPGGAAIDRQVFDGAAELEDGSYGPETLRRLMEDDGVPAVVLGEGAVLDLNDPEGGPFVLEKPLMTESGSTLYANWLTVPESSALRVDGFLDCRGLILLEGTGTRFQLEGSLSPDGEELAVILMEQGGNLAMDPDLARAMEGQLLLLPRREEAKPVSDLWQLQEGLRLYDTLSIDGDLTLDKTYDLAGKTVFIGPDADVQSACPGAGLALNGSVLVNEGQMSCDLLAEDAVVYNRGTIAGENDVASAQLREGSLMLNGGLFTPADRSALTAGGQLVNLGRAEMGLINVIGGNVVNLGQMELLADDGEQINGMSVQNDGAFYNAGTLIARDGSTFGLAAWLVNDGRIQLGDCREFRVGSIYNRHGTVEAAADWVRASGLLLGPGTVRRDSDDQLGWLSVEQTPSLERLPETYVTAEDEQDLRDGLESGETVFVPGNITLTGPLEVTSPLYIGGAVTAGPEAPVTVRDAALVLWKTGSLRAGVLRVYEGGAVALTEGCSLAVEKGGELTLEGPHSVLYGAGGRVTLDGVRITVQKAMFAPLRLESLSLDGADISIGANGAVLAPFRGDTSARDARVGMTGGRVLFPTDVRLEGTAFSVTGNGASVRFNGRKVLLEDCTVAVGETCEMVFGFSDVTMTEGTTIENDGTVWMDGREDGRFDAAGTLVNRGEMYLGTPKQVTVPIQNSGTLRLARDEGWNDHVDVEGVPPVWE